jgi:hypothetical protein
METKASRTKMGTTTLALYFVDHGDEDTPTLRELFKQSTVFVYEHSIRTESDERITMRLNALSEGRIPLEQFNRQVISSTTLSPLPALIQNSFVKVVLEQSPLSEQEIEDFHNLAWQDPPESLPLHAQLNELETTLRKMAEYDWRRDRALAEQLKRLHSENPDEKILVVRGAGHRLSLPAECRKVGLNPEVILGPCNPSAQNEAIALLAAGQQPTAQQLNEALQERRLNIRAV